MANYQFTCDHCGKSFTLETPEAKECPVCFWSSSVRRKDETEVSEQIGHIGSAASSGHPSLGNGLKFLRIFLKVLFFLAVLLGAGYLAYGLYGKLSRHTAEKGRTVSISGVERTETKNAGSSTVPGPVLTPEEKTLLERVVPTPDKPQPSEAEKIVLLRAVKFKTGWSGQLPTPSWTLSQYEQMLSEQERFYKITLPRSYKNKLKDLFRDKYLAAGDVFAKGDLLSTRNLLVESLGFPLYSTNVQKHRGVALTMLKPFINDTLSKIGALNQSLVEQGQRAKESEVAVSYAALMNSLQAGNWDEALRSVDQVAPVVAQAQDAARQQVNPPAYPAAINLVDQDIQRAMADLTATAPATAADLLRVREDLAQKRDILVDLEIGQYRKTVATYQDALARIKKGDYEDAARDLATVRGPESLRNDAQAKLAVLRKVTSKDPVP